MASESTRLRDSWIANSTAWCEAVREERIESRRLVTNAAVIDAIAERSPRRVLDLGCGEGWLARELAARGVAVTGVDASEPLITAARALGGGSFLVKTYEEVASGPEALGTGYDAVVANFSLLDEDVESLARAVRKVLAPHGRFIIQTVHPLAAAGERYEDGWRTETFSAIPGQWRQPMPWYFRTIGSWMGVLTRAGYVVAEMREPRLPNQPLPASLIVVCVLQ